MRVALVNPRWSFEGSIYFGCRAPHLPLELGYARAWLQGAGHEVLLLDGPLMGRSTAQLADEIVAFRPDMTVVPTAPSYLFWRCAPPELRVPREMVEALGGFAGTTVIVGPHGSSTPHATLTKTRADLVVLGECEEVVAALAAAALHTSAALPRGMAIGPMQQMLLEGGDVPMAEGSAPLATQSMKALSLEPSPSGSVSPFANAPAAQTSSEESDTESDEKQVGLPIFAWRPCHPPLYL